MIAPAPPRTSPATCCGVAVRSRVLLPIDRGAVARERLYWRFGWEPGDGLRGKPVGAMSIGEDNRDD